MTYRPKGMVSFSTCMRSLLRLSNRWKEGVSPVPSSRWRPFDFPPGPASSSVTSTLTFILLIISPCCLSKQQTGDRVLPRSIRSSVSFNAASFLQNLKADVSTFPGTNP